MASRSFEDLEIYKRARILRNVIFKLVESFPTEEKFKLTDQIIRSSRKCPANIAEGHGRFHFQENIQYCRIARGSLTETIEHLNCALDCKYILNTKHSEIKGYIETLIKMINGYIKYLNTQKTKT